MELWNVMVSLIHIFARVLMRKFVILFVIFQNRPIVAGEFHKGVLQCKWHRTTIGGAEECKIFVPWNVFQMDSFFSHSRLQPK